MKKLKEKSNNGDNLNAAQATKLAKLEETQIIVDLLNQKFKKIQQ